MIIKILWGGLKPTQSRPNIHSKDTDSDIFATEIYKTGLFVTLNKCYVIDSCLKLHSLSLCFGQNQILSYLYIYAETKCHCMTLSIICQ